jgi:hypothetical protein
MTAPRQGEAHGTVTSGAAGQDGTEANSQTKSQVPAYAQVQQLVPIFFNGENEESGFSGPQATEIVTPLAQLEPDPAIDWHDQAVAALTALRERFAKAIGADHLDPANPEYAERWRAAQPANDEAYRITFGQQAFEARQLEAARQALAQAQQEAAMPAN